MKIIILTILFGVLNDACDHIGKYWDFPKDIVATDDLQADKVKVYPNPSSQYILLHVDNAASNEAYQYQMTDITGIIIQQGSVANHGEIDISQRPAGIYIMQISRGGTVYHTQKIVVTK